MSAARTAAALLLPALLVVVLYWPAAGHRFLDVDDDVYVTANYQVLRGLTREGFVWAFTSLGYAANWHPLTWLSHMADVELFGLHPAGHHLVNVLLHLLAVVLLFLLLRGMTGSAGRSLLVALLFAAHPLHVESVAWLAQRKDLLAAVLYLAALAAWLRWLRRPGPAPYLASLALATLGLTAKPTVVTLPVAMLILDFWPLGRLRAAGTAGGASGLESRLAEKIPFLALSLIGGAAAAAAQARGGSLVPLSLYGPARRLEASAAGYLGYLEKAVWPRDLAFFYPYPEGGVPAGRLTAALAVLAGLSLLAFLAARRRPALTAGWLWFLALLLPVIGLVQVGHQALADRYAYLPLAGLFLAAAWSLPAPPSPRRAAALGLAAAAVILPLAAAARLQLTAWRDTERLLTHAMAVTRGNWLAANNLGDLRFRQGRTQEAMALFEEALRWKPDYPTALRNLGLALEKTGRVREAAARYEAALAARPDFQAARINLEIARRKLRSWSGTAGGGP